MIEAISKNLNIGVIKPANDNAETPTSAIGKLTGAVRGAVSRVFNRPKKETVYKVIPDTAERKDLFDHLDAKTKQDHRDEDPITAQLRAQGFDLSPRPALVNKDPRPDISHKFFYKDEAEEVAKPDLSASFTRSTVMPVAKPVEKVAVQPQPAENFTPQEKYWFSTRQRVTNLEYQAEKAAVEDANAYTAKMDELHYRAIDKRKSRGYLENIRESLRMGLSPRQLMKEAQIAVDESEHPAVAETNKYVRKLDREYYGWQDAGRKRGALKNIALYAKRAWEGVKELVSPSVMREAKEAVKEVEAGTPTPAPQAKVYSFPKEKNPFKRIVKGLATAIWG